MKNKPSMTALLPGVRVTPELKALCEQAAAQQRRDLSAWIRITLTFEAAEYARREYAKVKGITFIESTPQAKGRRMGDMLK